MMEHRYRKCNDRDRDIRMGEGYRALDFPFFVGLYVHMYIKK